jgi:arylsulfatase A-like enzyme
MRVPFNVLVMVADDHRHDAMGCAGDPVVRTPNMDALAARGVRFGRHQTAGGLTDAVCIPSRAQILTGCGPFRSSASQRLDRSLADRDALGVIPPERLTMPEAFRRAGYHTHAVGKWHNDRASFARSFASSERVFFGGMCDHDQVPLHDHGSAEPYRLEGFSTELFAEAALRFLAERHEEPFFLYLAFTSPHDPRTPPAAFRYDPASVPLPPSFMPKHPFDNGELRVRDELLAGFPRTPEEVRQHVADYYGMISHQDHWMGRILAGLPENTIVVYTADHGLAVGRHGLMGKQNLYDHSLRVPLIVASPDLRSDVVVDVPTTQADLLPTIAELAGVPAPEGIEGRSLAGPRPEPIPLGAVYLDVMRALTDGSRKLIRYRRSERGVGSDRVQLFDLAADPNEMHDLSPDPAQGIEVTRLSAELTAWQRAVGDPWSEAFSGQADL